MAFAPAIAVATSIPAALDGPPGFEPNLGQYEDNVRYVARGPSYSLTLGCGGGAVYGLIESAGVAPPVGIFPDGATSCPGGKAESSLPVASNFYKGPDSRSWVTEIPRYARVVFSQVWPGADMVWQTRGSGLEYEFRLAAGVDPRIVCLRVEGAERVSVDGVGNLLIESAAGVLRHQRPKAFQVFHGRIAEVGVSFRIVSPGRIGFIVPHYDSELPIMIDPAITYSSFLGGSGWDAAYGVATDTAGNVYITGETASGDFPGSTAGPGNSSNRHLFVVKLSPQGSLIYTTVLASSGSDSGSAIAVDPAGGVYVAGTSTGSDFPATSGALSRKSSGVKDAVVVHLDPSGHVAFSTYLGGAGDDVATAIAVDSSGGIYVAGYTNSLTFPTTAGAPQMGFRGGANDAFLAKLNAAGSGLLYSTLLGGTGNDLASAVTVDGSGQACIAGYTDSAGLPVRGAVQPAIAANGDALIACLNASGTSWTVLTYFGGMGLDAASGIALDGSALYVTGYTCSPDFPVSSGAYQTFNRGAYDAFVAKLSLTSPVIVYSSLLGGLGADSATAIAVGSGGHAWVAGYTASIDFPLNDGGQSAWQGGYDAFLVEINDTGTATLFSTLLGGPGDDRATGVVWDSKSQSSWLVGYTGSVTFPVAQGAVETAAPASYNAFVTRIGTAATVLITNLTGPSNAAFVVGDSWRIVISGAPNQPVCMTGTFNGLPTGGTFGSTDASGNFSLSGLMTSAVVGNWRETWYVGGVQATQVVSFAVAMKTAVQLTNLTGSSNTVFHSGDRWRIDVSGMPNLPVTLIGLFNGATIGGTFGSTDGSGRLTLTGVMTSAVAGNWTETWYVGGVQATPSLVFGVQ